MKILLFTTNTNNSSCPPLGLFSIATYFQNKFPDLGIEFSIKAFKSFNAFQILKLVAREKPDLIGIGTYVWNWIQVLDLCEKIKVLYPQVKIVLGGPSVTFEDEKITKLIQRKVIDFAVKGEGERTFAELLTFLQNGNITSIANIPGLMGLNNSETIFYKEQPKEYLVDMNLLPNPYLVHPRLLKQAKKDDIVYIETSRGCPYKCGYCVAAKMTLRYKKLDLVINEIKSIASFGLKRMAILDGTLNFNILRTKEMLNRIIKLNFDLDLQFEIKAETLDDELISLLKRVGFIFVEIGLQTSNEDTLKKINRYHDRDKFLKNIRKLIENDVQFLVDLIIGLPDETIDDWFRSIDFCYDIGNIRFAGMVLKLLPNTFLFEERKKYGYKYDSEDMNRILCSNTMSFEMISLAEKINYILMQLWSLPGNEPLRPYIRQMCEKYYNNKLSLFLQNVLKVLNDDALQTLPTLKLEEKRKLIDCVINKE